MFVVGTTNGQFVPKDDWTLEGEELDDYLARERRLLYVAMTRARPALRVLLSRTAVAVFVECAGGVSETRMRRQSQSTGLQ